MVMKSELPHVLVLMAVYNGSEFLEEQFASIQGQEGVSVEVWVNDDGSVDTSEVIIQKWSSLGLVTKISSTNRAGHVLSFKKLIESVDEKAPFDYFAFSDQDDIWDADKLITSMNSSSKITPWLACANRRLTDTYKGNLIQDTDMKPIKLSFENALIQNVVYLHSVVLNRAGFKLAQKNIDAPIVYLDAWFYLIFINFGDIFYNPQPLLTYRIHPNNTIGLGSKVPHQKYRNFKNYIQQSYFFCSIYSSKLSPNGLKTSKQFQIMLSLNPSKKLVAVFKSRLHRQAEVQTWFSKLALLFIKVPG
jgi:glycosyltransferase involved in cell wall biosynthesis